MVWQCLFVSIPSFWADSTYQEPVDEEAKRNRTNERDESTWDWSNLENAHEFSSSRAAA